MKTSLFHPVYQIMASYNFQKIRSFKLFATRRPTRTSQWFWCQYYWWCSFSSFFANNQYSFIWWICRFHVYTPSFQTAWKVLTTWCSMHGIRISKAVLKLGVQELCWNNFGNNDGAKESRIIPEFWCNFKHNWHEIIFQIEIL